MDSKNDYKVNGLSSLFARIKNFIKRLFKRQKLNQSQLTEVVIGMRVYDKKFKMYETVVNRTINSFEITRTRQSEKGINCTNWFALEKFKDQFDNSHL